MASPGPAHPRFPLFDSLRAIAALSVLAFHLPIAIRMAADNPVRPYLFNLNAGIAVFFLLSAFLLYRPFARARYLGLRRPGTGAFARRRLLRIGPAYWVALPAVVILLGKSGEAAGTRPVFSAAGAPAYFGFLQVYDSSTLFGGISAAWTLCAELAFYAMLPLWAMLMTRKRAGSTRSFLRSELIGVAALVVAGVTWTSIAAAGSHVTAAVFVDLTRLKPWLYVLPAYLDHFAIGMGLAVVSVVVAERTEAPSAVRLIERAPWLCWTVAALAFFTMSHVETLFPDSRTTRFAAVHVLQAIFALALILPAVFGDPDRGLVRRLLGNRVLLWVGLVSYGVYLWHAAIIAKLARLGAVDSFSPAAFALTALGISVLIAAVSFYAIERPSLRLGRRWSGRAESQDADVRARDLPRHERPDAGL